MADHARAGGRRERVAEAAHVDAQQLELGAHVETLERQRLAGERGRSDVRHAVSGRDQSVRLTLEQRALADRENARIAGAAGAVDGDPAALADAQSRGPRKFVARPNPRRKYQQFDGDFRAVGKTQGPHAAVFSGHDFAGCGAEVDVHSELFDARTQHCRPDLVDLQRHQPRRKFDHVRFEPE